jgi:hypothetical protein
VHRHAIRLLLRSNLCASAAVRENSDPSHHRQRKPRDRYHFTPSFLEESGCDTKGTRVAEYHACHCFFIHETQPNAKKLWIHQNDEKDRKN